MTQRPHSPDHKDQAIYAPVQALWLGGNLTALQVLSIRSFLANGHPYHIYTYDEIGNLPVGAESLDASTVVPRSEVFTYERGFGRGSVAVFSDLFRYELLFRKGGWWVDTDVVCLKPFDFDDPLILATERNPEKQTTAATCVMRLPAGHAALEWCLGEIQQRDRTTLQWGDIGPRLLQSAIDRFGLEADCRAHFVFNPIDYWAFDELLAAAFDFRRLEQSFGVHLWNQKWNAAQRDPDYGGEPGSLYRHLRSTYLDSSHTPDRTTELDRHARFLEQRLASVLAEREDGYYSLERERSLAAEHAAALHNAERAHGAEKVAHGVTAQERDTLRADLTETRSLLTQERTAHEDTRSSLGKARDELDHERMAHHETARALERTRGDLQDERQRHEEHIRELERTRDDLQQERARHEASIHDLARARGEARALRQSLSWRLTLPLRKTYDVLARIAGLGRRR